MRWPLLVLVLASCGSRAEAPKAPPDAGKVVLQFYDVKDLCRPPPDLGPFDGPVLEPRHYEPRPEDPNDTRPDAEDLADEIKAAVEPESWRLEGGALDSKNRVLVARTTAEIHERIRRYLADLRAR